MQPVMSNPDIIKQLNTKIRQLQRPQSKPDSEFHGTLTGIEAFDALLPAGGLSGGTLIEWLSPKGGGGSTLATILAARLLERGDTARSSVLVVIDTNLEFYPPALPQLGIALNQVVLIRPAHIGEAIWAFEQSLRCSGVTITMAWIEHLADQTYRRLQLATEAGGGAGFLIRSQRYQRQRSWADARFLVTPCPGPGAYTPGSNESAVSFPKASNGAEGAAFRRLNVQLLHCRGRIDGGGVQLEINNETGDVHLASRLASTKAQPRKARA